MSCESDQILNYLPERYDKFNELLAKYEEFISSQPNEKICVTLPSGETFDGLSWKTTPLEILEKKSMLSEDIIIAKVDQTLWDLERPLESDCEIKFFTFEDPEGKQVFWHSTAHVFGHAVEMYYPGSLLCVGPPTEKNFFYDFFVPDRKPNGSSQTVRQTFDETAVKEIKVIVDSVTKRAFPFERMVATREDIIELFKYNKFKLEIISDKPEEKTFSVYRCGGLIDLCRGPHVRNTSKVFNNLIVNTSSTFWKGNADNASLQRLYGISFPSKEQVDRYLELYEKALKYDHRNVGKQQELFFFHPLSPGSCFFLPKGAIIYNRLVSFIQSQYVKRGFSEVVSPNIFSSQLWEMSGHWEHYADDMFKVDCDGVQFGLKPMNCPGHCLMFSHRTRSYRELPLRLADFGVLHRNEISGALSGLTRVRRFQQDDAHIFCEHSQIEEEIIRCIDFTMYVYEKMGFKANFFLSTRPDVYLGELEVWDNAENQLKNALMKSGIKFTVNPKDGAFYGPKIDICISDAMERPHQCGTIQLDFVLPERFKLLYTSDEQIEKRPVIIHRTVLGSIERMIGVLCEHCCGKWPFWLSPFQAIVMSVHSGANDYSCQVKEIIERSGFVCDVDNHSATLLRKKIANSQQKYNFILVVGSKEKENGTVSLRSRDGEDGKPIEIKIDDLISKFNQLMD